MSDIYLKWTVKILNYSCPIGFSLKLMVHKFIISSRFWINNMPWNKHMYDSINLANKNYSCLFPSLFKKPVKCYFVLLLFFEQWQGTQVSMVPFNDLLSFNCSGLKTAKIYLNISFPLYLRWNTERSISYIWIILPYCNKIWRFRNAIMNLDYRVNTQVEQVNKRDKLIVFYCREKKNTRTSKQQRKKAKVI